MMRPMRTTVLTLLCLVACGAEPKNTGAPPPSVPAAPMVEDHGPPRPLGKVNLGGMEIEVILLGEVTGGGANIDLAFPAGARMPSAARGWVGIETAVGSRKALLHKEGATDMHGHLDVPKPPPAGSQIWIEIEADGKTSAAAVSY